MKICLHSSSSVLALVLGGAKTLRFAPQHMRHVWDIHAVGLESASFDQQQRARTHLTRIREDQEHCGKKSQQKSQPANSDASVVCDGWASAGDLKSASESQQAEGQAVVCRGGRGPSSHVAGGAGLAADPKWASRVFN